MTKQMTDTMTDLIIVKAVSHFCNVSWKFLFYCQVLEYMKKGFFLNMKLLLNIYLAAPSSNLSENNFDQSITIKI